MRRHREKTWQRVIIDVGKGNSLQEPPRKLAGRKGHPSTNWFSMPSRRNRSFS
jgi:hypothetical protein